ncbi:sensor histidine kinase [Actinoplanes sp. NPDC051851]|uniref:sensor histidine kinase n=1 Tax=Actinoplanes sp. NPDC051851 TaxID=3154753 RepID=UPI003435C805
MAQTGAVFTVTDRHVESWRKLRGVVSVVIVTVAMFQDRPRPGLDTAQGLAILAGVTLGAVAGVAMSIRQPTLRRQAVAVGCCFAAGLLLCAVGKIAGGPFYLVAAGVVGAMSLPGTLLAAMSGTAGLLMVAALAAHGMPWSAIGVWSGVLALVLSAGVIRRQRAESAEQRRLLGDEQARAATLAERARLAREIHDVLAHSLSALSVQLETAAALLERDRAAEAAVLVDRAGTLARDGLTETRRAVSALRGDPLPVPELVRELTAGYGDDLGAPAGFAVEGEPRELAAETGLALFRAAQEALTNVRRHAPGSAVTVLLAYAERGVHLIVRNHGPAGPPLSGLSSGYGLIGLRERAEMAGGSVEAGPEPDGWRVDVRMPG